MLALIRNERKLGLRIFGMDEESCSAVDVGTQQAQAFVGGVPRFDHDVIEFVAEEVFDDALVARLNLEEIGKHSGGSIAALQASRLKQAAHCLGRVPVLGDNRFERTFFAEG